VAVEKEDLPEIEPPKVEKTDSQKEKESQDSEKGKKRKRNSSDDDDEENESDADEKEIKKASKKEKDAAGPETKKFKVKGSAAVHPDSGLDDVGHIYETKGTVFNAVLNLTGNNTPPSPLAPATWHAFTTRTHSPRRVVVVVSN